MDYDTELGRHYEVLRRVSGIRPGDRVLDIGCGTGQTTRDAGRAAYPGWALGVDISAAMLQRARELADADGLRNVTFIHADAQIYAFSPEAADIAISRFGTMFFADPAGAFANIGRALRANGRLVMLVWRVRELNEWDIGIQQALGTTEFGPNESPSPLDPFSLGDAHSVRQILAAAGFADVMLDDVDEPVFYGRDVDEALAWVRQFASTKERLGRLDAEARAASMDRLRATLAAHHRRGGVWFDSRAWIVTAQRRQTESVVVSTRESP